MKQNIRNIVNKIKSSLTKKNNIVIVTHHIPDGDAIGASLALYSYFKLKKYNVSIITPSNYPKFLKWLPNTTDVIIYNKSKDKTIKKINTADYIFMLDFNELTRTNELEPILKKSNALKILIDHHPNPASIAKYIISDTSVSSTAELVFEFINAFDSNKWLNKDIATCILTGILTDTGVLNFNSSLPRTYEIISNLLTRKIDKDAIIDNIYNNFSEYRMRLLGYCLNEKMKILPQYNTGYIVLSQDEQKRFNFEAGDSEGFVNYPLCISGIRFSALIIEKTDHIKLSFRSKGKLAANIFATKYFNGGGHHNAAAGQIKTTLQEAEEMFLRYLPGYIKKNID